MKNLLMTVVKVAVSGTIMYLLFRGMDLQAFWGMVSSINPLIVVAVIAIIFAVQCVSTFRWSIILKKDAEVLYRKLLSMYLVGMFFNNFLPTLVGGDVIKGYYLYKESGKGGLAVASVFMDRYLGFSALMLITMVALIFGSALIEGTGLKGFFVLLLGGYAGASLILWVDWLHSWAMKLMRKVHFYSINDKIDALYKVLMSYKSHQGLLVKAFGCGLIVQGTVIIAYYLLGVGLGMDIPLGYFFLFIPLATAASMIPLSLAGLGIREGVFVFLFAKVGATQEEAVGVSLLFFVLLVIVSLVGGVEYVRIGGKKGAMAAAAEGGEEGQENGASL